MVEAIAAVGLFTFGLCYLVKYTNGPWNVFVKFRVMLGTHRVPVLEGKEVIVDYIEESDGSFFGDWIDCWWCFSTWIAGIVALVYCLIFVGISWMALVAFPFTWFGAVGVAGVIHNYIID